jgi:hypothetical protein
MTTVVDLNVYLKQYTHYSDMSKGNIDITKVRLPKLVMPDGPTWHDRVKRAERIGEIVSRELQRAQEELEENFLDLRDVLLSKIKKRAPAGYRVEGTKLYLPSPDADLGWLVVDA